MFKPTNHRLVCVQETKANNSFDCFRHYWVSLLSITWTS